MTGRREWLKSLPAVLAIPFLGKPPEVSPPAQTIVVELDGRKVAEVVHQIIQDANRQYLLK